MWKSAGPSSSFWTWRASRRSSPQSSFAEAASTRGGYPSEMSQPTARRSARAGTDANRIEIKGDPAFFRRFNYPAVAAGFVWARLVDPRLGRSVGARGGPPHPQAVAEFAHHLREW